MTGASSGIGRSVAISLGARHARIALVSRRKEPLDSVAEEIERAGGEALVITADVTDAQAVRDAVERTVRSFGGLRLLVPNAGIGRYGPATEQDVTEIEQLMRINYLGAVHTIRAALPHLLDGSPSHIAAVSSSAGLIPHIGGSAYCASKAALNSYLAALRLEVLDRGIGVSWICPGAVDTPFFDGANLDPDVDLPLLARIFVRKLDPNEVARTILRAVEHNRREIVLPPMLRFFAWTRRMTPTFADYLNRTWP